jgi:hypothetical protein
MEGRRWIGDRGEECGEEAVQVEEVKGGMRVE